jgi:hypothetical protein
MSDKQGEVVVTAEGTVTPPEQVEAQDDASE